MEQYAYRSQLLCGGAVFTWYCRRDAFAHQPGKRQAERGVHGAAGLCWYEDSKLQTPLFVGQFDGSAQQAQLPGKLFTQKIGRARKQSARRCFAVSQTQQGEAQIWRREVSSRYGQYPKAQAAQLDQLMSDQFFPRVSLAMQNKTLLFLDTRWLITRCETLE